MTIRLKPEVVVITLTNLHHEVGHDLYVGIILRIYLLLSRSIQQFDEYHLVN